MKGCIFAHMGFSLTWKRVHCLATLSSYPPFTSNSQIKSLANELENIGHEHLRTQACISLSVRSRFYSFYSGKLVKESNPQEIFTRDLVEKGYELAEQIVFLCISILQKEKEKVDFIQNIESSMQVSITLEI